MSDTNFYGLLASDESRLKIIEKIKLSSKLMIYGFRIIRNELRDVPKSIRIHDRSLRIDLLNLYDSIVGEHNIEFTGNIQKTAENYYKAYKEFGGIKPKEEILNDFLIVSAASLNNLDIVVSDDEKSMKMEKALRAYSLINSIMNKKTPRFIAYAGFKNLLRGEPNEIL